MKLFSFFDEATGAIGPVCVSTSDHRVASMTPSGHRPIEGRFDRLSQRVDLDVWHQLQTHRAMGGVRPEDEAGWESFERELLAKLVIDYQPDPPEPAAHYEWNTETKRWLKRAEIAAAERASAQARAEIQRLEASQLRPMRELQLDPNNTDAIQRLDAINARISELRAQLIR